MFIRTGDIMMPSVALASARFSAKHGVGTFGTNLFANTVVDPSKQDTSNVVIYFDSDLNPQKGGNVRTLGSGTSWFVDQMLISASANNSAKANALMRKHVNFLCSARMEPVYIDEDQMWCMFLHFALDGRAKRVGRTPAGMELYECIVRVLWRPLSEKDKGYEQITGVS